MGAHGSEAAFAAALTLLESALGHLPAGEPELEEKPDVPYDRSMWTDAEDEGFGVPDRHAL